MADLIEAYREPRRAARAALASQGLVADAWTTTAVEEELYHKITQVCHMCGCVCVCVHLYHKISEVCLSVSKHESGEEEPSITLAPSISLAHIITPIIG